MGQELEEAFTAEVVAERPEGRWEDTFVAEDSTIASSGVVGRR